MDRPILSARKVAAPNFLFGVFATGGPTVGQTYPNVLMLNLKFQFECYLMDLQDRILPQAVLNSDLSRSCGLGTPDLLIGNS